MTKAEFKHYDLSLVEPAFDSPLTDLVIDLNHLRKKRLDGTTPSQIFFNLKSIFHCWRASAQRVSREITPRFLSI